MKEAQKKEKALVDEIVLYMKKKIETGEWPGRQEDTV